MLTVRKGTRMRITHVRKGMFMAKAYRDFDAETEEFFPVELDQDKVRGMSEDWQRGARIPCRKSLLTNFKILEN